MNLDLSCCSCPSELWTLLHVICFFSPHKTVNSELPPFAQGFSGLPFRHTGCCQLPNHFVIWDVLLLSHLDYFPSALTDILYLLATNYPDRLPTPFTQILFSFHQPIFTARKKGCSQGAEFLQIQERWRNETYAFLLQEGKILHSFNFPYILTLVQHL